MATVAIAIGIARPAFGQSGAQPLVEPYAAAGVQSGREHATSLDDVATVDPFTGMLQISHTDISFPGVGPELRMVRSYNSSVLRQSNGGPPVLRPRNLMASNWNFHFGYVSFSGAVTACDVPVATPNSAQIPILVLADGARLPLYQPTAASGNTHHYVAANGWVADCVSGSKTGFVARDQAGTIYEFTRLGVVGESGGGSSQTVGYQLEVIRDPHGNTVTMNYTAAAGIEEIASVTASDGRQLSFIYEAYSGGRRLREARAVYQGGVREAWIYRYAAVPGAPGYSQLISAEGPENLTWSYGYETQLPATHEIASITGPYGATKTFQYGLKPNPVPNGVGDTVAVTDVTWSGPGLISSQWSYVYGVSATDWRDTTSVFGPETVAVHTFCGERVVLSPSLDPMNCGPRLGSLEQKDLYLRGPGSQIGALLQSETFSWFLPALSDQTVAVRYYPSYRQAPAIKLLDTQSVRRQAETFNTQYTNYSLLTFRPGLQRDWRAGDAANIRNTETTYYVDSASWIVKPSFVRLYDYQITDTNGVVRSVGANGEQRTYNPDGTVASLAAGGATSTFTYYSNGLPATYTQPGRGGAFEAQAYELGVVTNLYSVGRAARITRTLNTAGYVATETDWQGKTTGYSYDGLGRVVAVSTPKANDFDISVARSFSARTEVQTRGSLVETTRLDAFGRPYEVERANTVIRTEYDALGRVVFVSDPVPAAPGLAAQCVDTTAAAYCDTAACPGQCTVYDGLGRVVQTTYTKDGSTSQFSFPSAIQSQVTNAKGQVTTYTHERFGDPDEHRPTRIEQEHGVVTNIFYYHNGQPYSVTQDGDGALGVYGRYYNLDEDGRLIEEFNPEGNWSFTQYDSSSRPALTYDWDPDVSQQNRVSYIYDAADRLWSYGPESDLTQHVVFTYDNNNRTRTASYDGTVWTYGFDANGNQTTEELAMDGRTFRFRRTYNKLDYLNVLTYPSGRTVTYNPDVLGRPRRARPHLTAVSHFPNGGLKRITYGNGDVVRYTQDPKKPALTKRIRGGPIDLIYSYDAIGNVTRIRDRKVAGNDMKLRYDRLNRLTYGSGRWGVARFAYDVQNGIRRKTVNDRATNYTYGYNTPAAGGSYTRHQLLSTSGDLDTDFAYDNQGNVAVSREIQGHEFRQDEFNYNWMNRATSHRHIEYGQVLNPYGGANATSDIIERDETNNFAYDGLGYRVKTNGSRLTIYSGARLMYEEDQQENVAREYIYLGMLGVAEVTEDCSGASAGQPWCPAVDQAPRLVMLSPRGADRPDHRTPLLLEAVAYDAEDGDLSASIDWYANLFDIRTHPSAPNPEVFLGTGASIAIAPLPPGYQRIEARVQDASGATAVASVRFEVLTAPNTAPTPTLLQRTVTATVNAPLSVGPLSSWFSDADGDALTMVPQGLPTWLSLVGDHLVGTPGSQASNVQFTLTAYDGVASSTPVAVDVQLVSAAITWTGTPGDDTFFAGNLGDTLSGLGGNDTIFGYSGDDFIYGGPGADGLLGGDGNDRIEGGPGGDTLRGDAGDDLFVYSSGDGSDAIYDSSGNDELFFTDLLPTDVSFQFSYGAVGVFETQRTVVLGLDGTRLLSIGECVSTYCSGAPATVIESVRFADGSVWTVDVLRGLYVTTTGDDHFYGTPGDDVMTGGAGDDVLDAGAGADTLYGGEGTNTLVGGAGDDAYVFDNTGFAHNRVQDVGGVDSISFVAVASSQVVVSRSGGHLVISTPNGSVTLEFYYDSGFVIESVAFSDGVVWNQATLEALVPTVLNGTSNSETLQGTAGTDTINAYEGDDTVFAYASNDVIDTGPGNDTVYGGPGNDTVLDADGDDTYHFGLGDGSDVIFDFAGNDQLVFGPGITRAMLSFSIQVDPFFGDSLLIQVAPTGDSVLIQAWPLGYHIEQIRVGGQVLTPADVNNELP